jgi:hypothetical protein
MTFFEVSPTVIKNMFFSQRTLQLSAQKRKLGVIKVYVSFLCKCRTLVSGLPNLKSDFIGFPKTLDSSMQEHCRLEVGI